MSYFGFGFISVYNLIAFCCFRRNVTPCCHTHDSLSTVIVYSARVRLVGLTLGRSRAVEPWRRWLIIWWWNTRIPAINEKPATGAIYKPRCCSYWSQSQILVENRDFSLPHLHSRPPLGGFPSEYCHAVCYRKTRMVGLPDGGKSLICLFVLTQLTNVTDGQTDGAWQQRPLLIAWQSLQHS